MKLRRTFVVVGLAGGVLASVWGAAKAADAVRARPAAVAVVDIQSVFESLKEKEKAESDLKTQLDKLAQQENERKKELETLQNDLEILAPNTPAFNEMQELLEQKTMDLQTWHNFQSLKLNRERVVLVENLYRKMIDAIGRVSQQNGYDIVLFKEKPADFRGAKPEALTAMIQVRKVLWSAEELDLTDQVIQLMNNEFTNMTSKAAP